MDKMPPILQASLGTDSAFGRPSISAKNAGPEELRQAAEAFESMFVRMILAQGHQTQLAKVKE